MTFSSLRGLYVPGAMLLTAAFALFPAAAQTAPITLAVDLRDAPRKILHMTETIPVQPGAMTLVYPKWIPGEHMPSGPIDNQAGLFITGNGPSSVQIRWERDPLDMFSYHLTVPAGVTSLTVKADFLATPNGGSFTAGGSTSENLAVLSWNTLVMYPYSGPQMQVSSVMVTPSLMLPSGWKFGTALETGAQANGSEVSFKTVSLEQLVDSPVITGRFFREVVLAPEIKPAHYLDMIADGPEDLAISQEHIDQFSNLIRQTGYLYRARHYGSYHFLVTLSDEVLHFGLEHHQSSDDRVSPTTFISDTEFVADGLLLPHEFTHSWNGKYRRPAGLATPNYQVPMVGDLLWVYEGLTEYLGDVLAARSGIWTPEQYRDRLANYAANYNNRPGRTWRDVADTARMAQILYNVGGPFDNWRLGTDFYDEGELLWLDVDVTIRQMTNNKKSLNDFTAAFHGLGGNTGPKVIPYTFEDVVTALNGVVANDWTKFLNDRIVSLSPVPPMGGITNGGYRLVYKDTPNSWAQLNGVTSFWYSLGLGVRANGSVGDVLHFGLSDKAGIAPGMKIIAVNGRAFSTELLRVAVKEAKGTSNKIDLIVENTGFYKVISLDYHDGERYPAFERIAGTPDRLDQILAPMTK